MISNAPRCDVCGRRNIVTYRVEPEEAWKVVVLGRWRNVCPSCFDAEAEKARVLYRFVDVEADLLVGAAATEEAAQAKAIAP